MAGRSGERGEFPLDWLCAGLWLRDGNRRDRGRRCGFWLCAVLLQIGIKCDADEGIKGDSDALAVGAGGEIDDRRQSDINGHGASMVSDWPHIGPNPKWLSP